MTRATAMTPQDRRRAIIEAVEPLLLTQGAELTTRQIAEAAGVAEGTLFRVFGSKQELLRAAALAALASEPAIRQLKELPGGVPLQQHVTAILEILLDEHRRTRSLAVAFLRRPGHCPSGAPPPHGPEFDPHQRHQRIVRVVADSLASYACELGVPPRSAGQALVSMAFAASFDLNENTFTQASDVAGIVLYGIARGSQ